MKCSTSGRDLPRAGGAAESLLPGTSAKIYAQLGLDRHAGQAGGGGVGGLQAGIKPAIRCRCSRAKCVSLATDTHR